ncbi:hypothetical protein HZA57_08830, partial [Candidatus Poribacteria bacterium]|nr:hypothetical protein [Candidatus Poribacteria bacterium]
MKFSLRLLAVLAFAAVLLAGCSNEKLEGASADRDTVLTAAAESTEKLRVTADNMKV